MYKLGQRAKDSITGIEGVITARAEYLYGCVRCELTLSDKFETHWVDEQRLTKAGSAKVGGFHDAPPSHDP